MTESFFKIKTLKSLMEVVELFLNVKNFESRKQVMESFVGITNFKTLMTFLSGLKALRFVRQWWSFL